MTNNVERVDTDTVMEAVIVAIDYYDLFVDRVNHED